MRPRRPPKGGTTNNVPGTDELPQPRYDGHHGLSVVRGNSRTARRNDCLQCRDVMWTHSLWLRMMPRLLWGRCLAACGASTVADPGWVPAGIVRIGANRVEKRGLAQANAITITDLHRAASRHAPDQRQASPYLRLLRQGRILRRVHRRPRPSSSRSRIADPEDRVARARRSERPAKSR